MFSKCSISNHGEERFLKLLSEILDHIILQEQSRTANQKQNLYNTSIEYIIHHWPIVAVRKVLVAKDRCTPCRRCDCKYCAVFPDLKLDYLL